MKVKQANWLFLIIMILFLAIHLLIVWLDVSLPLALTLLLSELIFIIPTVVFLWVKKINPLKLIPHKRMGLLTFLLTLVYMLCMYPVVVFCNTLSMVFTENAAQELMTVISQVPLWYKLFAVAVVPAFCEEFVFRGVLYHSYRRLGVWKAIFCTAILFGLAHGNINQMSYAMVMGIAFALLTEAAGSIYPAMLIHFLFNGFSTVMSHFYTAAGTASLAEESGLAMMYPQYSAEMLEKMALLLGAAMWGLIAAGTIIGGYFLLILIGKINGREKHMRIILSPSLYRQSEKKRREAVRKKEVSEGQIWVEEEDGETLAPSEKLWDIPFVIALILCVAIFFV